MAKQVVSRGLCECCKTVVAKPAMTRHLAACPARTAATSGTPTTLHHLVIESPGAPGYWLHVEVPSRTTLATLDAFLRDLWLECCGHLSAFRIGGVTYASMPDPDAAAWAGTPEKSLGSTVGPLVAFCPWKYEYDYGSTTELRVRAVGARHGSGHGVRLLARNLPRSIPCERCGLPATLVCTQCLWEGAGWLCDACAETHPCGDDYALPVVNSPRVGVCGYTG